MKKGLANSWKIEIYFLLRVVLFRLSYLTKQSQQSYKMIKQTGCKKIDSLIVGKLKKKRKVILIAMCIMYKILEKKEIFIGFFKPSRWLHEMTKLLINRI